MVQIKIGKMFKIFVIFVIILFSTPCFSQDQITLRVSTNEASIEDQIDLTVSVSGVQTSEQPTIEPKGFELIYRGTSSQVQIINGKMSSQIDFNYTIIPKITGNITIGPATLNVNGKIIKSQTITIRILPSSQRPQYQYQHQETQSQLPSKDLFITTTVSNKNPFEGEQIIYTFRFFRKVRAGNANLDLPDFNNFWVEDIGKQKDYQRVINGEIYLITEINKALFPTTTGTLKIDRTKLVCDVESDDFWGEPQQKILQSEPIVINVKPLPGNKPSNFSNLVGDFNISSSISQQNTKVGESVTLTVEISGYGNIKDALISKWDNLNDFKVYDDKPTTQVFTNTDNLGGKKIFKRAIVPMKPGEIKIPALKLVYFNPKLGRYITKSTNSVILKVLPGEQQEILNPSIPSSFKPEKEQIKLLGKDILNIHTSINLSDQYLNKNKVIFFTLFFLIPPFIFTSILLVEKRRHRFNTNPGLLRKKEALNKAYKNINKLTKIDKEKTEFYTLLSRTIKEYIGDKLNISGSAYTTEEIVKKLREYNIKTELIDNIEVFLKQCEQVQFGGISIEIKQKDLIHELKRILKGLERTF